MNEQKLREIIDEFTLNGEELQQIAAAFRRDIEVGLEDGTEWSSLKMLQSYIGLPTGSETGEFLALDFGGTNVRVLLVRLSGSGACEIVRKAAKPLTVSGSYDYVGAGACAEEMFDFIAGLVGEVVEEGREYLLGHTFSFPSEQTDLYNARLLTWTKEFATRGVEGQVVNDLLTDAMKRRGIYNVRPVAVINDTVATLLAAAYKTERTFIGSICATGHNTAYLEPYTGQSRAPMILNLESGNFNKLVANRYDRILDDASEKPGEQRLEKMVSGRYLGELFKMAVEEGFAWKARGAADARFTSIDLSAILSDGSAKLGDVQALLREKTNIEHSVEECEWARAIAESIVIRSARLVGATYSGIIWHLDGETASRQHIAIDGSLYEKTPLYKGAIRQALLDILGDSAENVELILENSGSGIGAAIAASVG